MPASKHRYDIDLCRAIACLMAIATHIPDICSADGLSPFVTDLRSGFIYFCRAVIPIFYMVTGSLYLGKETADVKKTVKKAFKLLLMFLVWSALYIARSQYLFHTYHTFNEFYAALFTGHYHLWFLTALASAYFFLPLLHGAIHGVKVSLRYIIILFVSLAIVKYNAEIFIPEIWRGPLTMFSANVVPILVYMPYGYYLSKREITGKFTALLGALTLFTIPFSVRLINRYGSVISDLTAATMLPQSLMLFVCSSFAFALCRYIASKTTKPNGFVMLLSGLSLGIYLVHPFVIDEIYRLEYIGAIPALFTENLQYLRYPFIFVVTVVLSFALAFILKKIPVLNKLVQ
jgi:surface polysaccharide O-acyltransferase-like enzyme